MANDDTTFRRLLELGRERGFVTLDQVNAVLPIENMSQRELAEILDRLERSGVSVELDEELTVRPRGGAGDGAGDMEDFTLPDPPDEESARVVPIRPKTRDGDGGQFRRPAAMTEAQDHRGADHKAAGGESTSRTAIVIGVLLLLIVFAFVLLR
jgi:hypothetical protein